MTTNLSAASSSAEGAFVTTHWSIVASARDGASPQSIDALEKLCRSYWFPLYAYVRRLGRSPSDAEDLTQSFFAQLLKKGTLKTADRQKGRFRTFLLTAFKHFLANEWERQHAQKRGGFSDIVPLEQDFAEARLAAENSLGLPPDVLYDRHWAMALLERTMTSLNDEYVATGRASLFEYLRPCLAKEESALPYAEIARQLKLTEAAVKMAVLRLRARYREILRTEIAQTLYSTEDVEEEIRHLFRAFT